MLERSFLGRMNSIHFYDCVFFLLTLFSKSLRTSVRLPTLSLISPGYMFLEREREVEREKEYLE